jgi:hypothetical protein
MQSPVTPSMAQITISNGEVCLAMSDPNGLAVGGGQRPVRERLFGVMYSGDISP